MVYGYIFVSEFTRICKEKKGYENTEKSSMPAWNAVPAS